MKSGVGWVGWGEGSAPPLDPPLDPPQAPPLPAAVRHLCVPFLLAPGEICASCAAVRAGPTRRRFVLRLCGRKQIYGYTSLCTPADPGRTTRGKSDAASLLHIYIDVVNSAMISRRTGTRRCRNGDPAQISPAGSRRCEDSN